MLMMLPSRALLRARAVLNRSRKDCDATNAVFKCESSMACHADSGYRSNGPVSSAASAGEDPRPALLTRIVGGPECAATAFVSASTAARTATSTAGLHTRWG